MAVISFITWVPRANVIKLFTAVSCAFSYRAFVLGKPFQPIIMFAGKEEPTRAKHLSDAPF
jgi:hypothetical protein